MMIRNRNTVSPLVLTAVFCAMVVALCAQNHSKLPSAVFVHKHCNTCQTYDTLCQFRYGDIVLTEDSITFNSMDCIHAYDDQDTKYSFLHDSYLIFSFPNGKKYIMELIDYFSSFVPQYAPIIYRRDCGNTLPIRAKFGNDWRKSLWKFIKKWNSYNHREEVVLNIIECGTNYSRMIQIQGEDTVFEASHYDTDTDLQFDPDYDRVEIVDGDTIFHVPEFFPKFPGGADSLNAYLQREKRWHDNPFLDVAGTVLVEFVVERDGSVTQPRVKVSLNPEFHDKEALRVIQSMPKWEPATVNGTPVRCYYQIPVTWRM